MNERQGEQPRKAGLAPIAVSDSRLFILGSLPGDASLAAGRYYAHPRNQFWRLLGMAIGEDLHSLTYDERLSLLMHRKIGLWDVVASAVRPGSLDQSLRAAEHNRLDDLLSAYPAVRAIAFNGQTASVIGRRMLSQAAPVEIIDLPSSSPANTASLEDKLRTWVRLADFL